MFETFIKSLEALTNQTVHHLNMRSFPFREIHSDMTKDQNRMALAMERSPAYAICRMKNLYDVVIILKFPSFDFPKVAGQNFGDSQNLLACFNAGIGSPVRFSLYPRVLYRNIGTVIDFIAVYRPVQRIADYPFFSDPIASSTIIEELLGIFETIAEQLIPEIFQSLRESILEKA